MRKYSLSHLLAPGYYAAIIIITLALTGIYQAFANREVIVGTLNLNDFLLVLMLLGAGFAAGVRGADVNGLVSLATSLSGAVLAGVSLAVLVIFNILIDMGFVFQNLGNLNESTLTFGRKILLNGDVTAHFYTERFYPAGMDAVATPATRLDGLWLLLGFSVVCGLLAWVLVYLPDLLRALQTRISSPVGERVLGMAADRLRGVLVISVGLTVVLGMVVGQIEDIVSLPDALALAVVFALGYAVALLRGGDLTFRAGLGFAAGVVVGVVLALVANSGGLEEGGVLRGVGDAPAILELALENAGIVFVVIMGITGMVGALAANGSQVMNNGAIYFLTFLVVLGVLNWQGEMSPLAAVLTFTLFSVLFFIAPLVGERASTHYEQVPDRDQRVIRLVFVAAALFVLVIAPQFMGAYISNVFNLIALYAVMGIGLNVMIGYTGLLDLGYVASFAIGAYTLGILSAPNILTCGGVHPDDIIPFTEIPNVCTGMFTFWQALPFCVLVSALTGMMLGVPVLGLRGDYLAIVTLGFGEITNRIIGSEAASDLLGGSQGIGRIPTPVVNLSGLNADWFFDLNSSTTTYYLFLASVMIAAFVVYRLANSRLGRAWRAIRADEDVAEAMGIHLIGNKLLAFGVSSAFAGLGGAVFGASLQGISPNSFTLLVSINVLSLIIIGGMGSIPGVILGAMILVGLPELLRELEAYRLLGFGALLVIVMLTKPEGLLPPIPARLSERASPGAGGATLLIDPDGPSIAPPVKEREFPDGSTTA
jgi:branched-chain amino acid transport system permease protein